MTNEISSPQQIKIILNPIFKKHNIRKVILFDSSILFDSYYKENKQSKNDIYDKCILVDSGLKGMAFYGFFEDIVMSLGKDVILLDISQITPNSIVEDEIAKTGVVIYEDNDKKVLGEIYEDICFVLEFTKNCTSLEDFSIRCCGTTCALFLRRIGELAQTSLSDEFKQTLNSIPWKQLYGLRNCIAYDNYFGVNMRIVWDVINESLPKLAYELKLYI